MSDAISVSAPISGTDRTMSFEAGKLAQLADGAVLARIGDTVLLATATAARSVREGTDFFPLTVDIEERTYAAGQDPRLVLPPGGQGLGPGHPDLPADRPPPAAVLPQRVPQRGPRRRHDRGGRPGQPARRPGHQRRFRCADDLGYPLRRTDRCRPGGLHHRGRVDRTPHLRGGRVLDLRAGRGRSGPDRRRRERDRHHDGRGRRDGEVLGLLRSRRAQGHRGGAGRRARGVQAMDPRVHQSPAPPGRRVQRSAGAHRGHSLLHLHRLPGRRVGPGRGRRHGSHRQGEPGDLQGRAQRRPRRRRRGDPLRAR